MTRAYVCMQISEYPPPRPLGFASDFLSRQECQNAVNHVFEKQISIFLRITQVLLETISRKMFYYRVVRVIPH